MIYPLSSFQSLISELRYAGAMLQARKLSQSSKWIFELLDAIQNRQKSSHNFDQQDGQVPLDLNHHNLSFTYDRHQDIQRSQMSQFNKVYFQDATIPGINTTNLARSLFDLKQFKKLAFKLGKCQHQNPIGDFLMHQSIYIIDKQNQQAEKLAKSDQVSKGKGVEESSSYQNNSTNKLVQELSNSQNLDAFGYYILGKIYKDQKKPKLAKSSLIQACCMFPLLWSAWLELVPLIQKQELTILPDHWMKNFWYMSFYIEKHQQLKGMTLALQIRRQLGLSSSTNQTKSVYLEHVIAHGSYLLLDYETSLNRFDALFKQDPFRYQGVDLYSNILYIKQNFIDLGHLAHHAIRCDKYRPQTCCAIGNYYSLRGDHVKAVTNFKRAVKLDPNFLSAWTLMGHQYLQLKNTSMAILCYRTAVDIDDKDFRAWYGLGQTYEIHQMLDYAVYYFQMAASARPNDSRMWNAVAQCYQKLDQMSEARKALQKAALVDGKSGNALCELGKLYSKQPGCKEQSLLCFEEYLNKGKGFSDNENNLFRAHYDLAQYAIFVKKDIQKAGHHIKTIRALKAIDPIKANKLIEEYEKLSNQNKVY